MGASVLSSWDMECQCLRLGGTEQWINGWVGAGGVRKINSSWRPKGEISWDMEAEVQSQGAKFQGEQVKMKWSGA